MKRFIFTASLLLAFCSVYAQKKDLKEKVPVQKNPAEFITHAEKTNFAKTPRFEETMEFFHKLEGISPMVNCTSFGTSPQGRELSLVIVDKDGLKTPESIRAKGRIIILVESCIHSGEPDGKDACMIWLRDMILHKKDIGLLDDVSFVFDPVFNVDGHEDFRATNRINQNGPDELGTRYNAQLLNLNRDFLKADAAEMKDWHRMYNYWDPELFIDCHVTNGADFQYVMTYDVETHGKAMAEPLHSFSKKIYEKELNERMTKVGFPMFPYCNYKRTYAPELGASLDVFDPRYSTSYVAYRNRLGLLLETHIYKPYKERVESTIESIRQSAYILQAHKKELVNAIHEADAFTASPEFRKELYPLEYKIDVTDSVYVDYLGWERDTIVSDLSGGKWVRHNYKKPMTYKVPLYNKHVPTKSVKVPEAYILMPQYANVAELLTLNGISYKVLDDSKEVEVETYRYTGGKFSPRQSEGRVPVIEAKYTTQIEKLTYPKGSYYIDMNQPNAKLAIFLLEPDAPGSLTYWGFFNSHVQTVNEFWVNLAYMEVKGREMLAADPELKKRFEEKKKNDPAFAKDPNAILNYFYDIVKKQSHQDNDIHPAWRVLK